MNALVTPLAPAFSSGTKTTNVTMSAMALQMQGSQEGGMLGFYPSS